MASGSPVERSEGWTLLSPARKRHLADIFERARHNSKAIVGFVIVLILVCTAIFGPMLISEKNANQLDPADRFEPPSTTHLFGTDNLGRDVFLRSILGTRTGLYTGSLAVLIATLFGVPLGAIAGYTKSVWDELIMRAMDIMMSFPPVLFALTITAVLGPNLTNTVIAIGVVYIPYFARVTRSEVVSISEEDYIEAAKALGERDGTILMREVLPNSLSPLFVQASISMAYAILAAAALSFLGLGAQPPTPDWGLMIQSAKQYVDQAPWMAIFPGLMIGVTVFGFNLLGDGARDVLDPTLKTDEMVVDDEQ